MTATAQQQVVMAPLVTHLVDLMGWSGRPVEQVLARAGVTREELAPRSGRLPVATAARLVHAALAETGDPQLLLKLSSVTYGTGFGVLGYLAQACPTLQDAVEALIRYGPLMSNAGHAELVREPGLAAWTLYNRVEDPVLERQATEYLLGVGYRFLLLVDARRSELVHEIRFRHAAPADEAGRAAYAEVFSCPVRFGAASNAIVLHAAALARPLRQPDVVLKNVVEQQAARSMDELAAPADFPALVRRELEALLLAGTASREALAERLGVSSRHLGRQLANAGLGYRELLDEIRMELARRYLQDSARTVADIGAALGFADGQSFIRWFRLETGMTPGDFRQRGA